MESRTLADVFRQRRHLDNIGLTLIEGGGREEFISSRQLYQLALKALGVLQDKGVQPKQEVLIQLDNNKHFLVVFWACILGGMVPVPLAFGQSAYHRQKLFGVWQVLDRPWLVMPLTDFYKLEQYAAAHGLGEVYADMSPYIIDEGVLDTGNKDGEPFTVEEHDLAFIQFSSGSTGAPKGVMLTHKNLLANIAAMTHTAAYTDKDSLMSWMPLTHDMGLIGFHINPLLNAVHHYLMPTRLFVRRPGLWLDKVSEHRITILCSPNFGYGYLIRHLDVSARNNWDLSHVKAIYNGAEPISDKLCYAFLRRFADYGLSSHAIRPVYGLAEASLAVTMSPLNEGIVTLHLKRGSTSPGNSIGAGLIGEDTIAVVNVGKPVPYCEVRIADNDDMQLNDETIGHIQIKGENVSAGYYNNLSETANVVTADGWLRTGDLGFMKDGALYVTGRQKDIIFLNGQNYYSHDIEQIAQEVAGIELNKIVIAGFTNTASRKEELAAFILHRDNLERFVPMAAALKAFILDKTGLAINKVIPVNDIPRTTSGKLQRFILLQQLKDGEFEAVEQELSRLLDEARTGAAPLTAPENDTERKLLEIWKQVLKRDRISTTDVFFEIGGDSLKTGELAMMISREFQVELSLEALYERRTIKEQANELLAGNSAHYIPIPASPESLYYPVSFRQRRLYYSWEVDKTGTTYNVPVAITIKGTLDHQKLEDYLRQLIQRHDALRMSFHMADEPVYKVHEHVDFVLTCLTCKRDELDERLKETIKPFDLSQPPLFRIKLFSIEDNEQLLFADFHHIIADGMSVSRFISELLEIYAGNKLPALPVQYKDFIYWERQPSAETERQKSYWINTLKDPLPVLEMPTDFKRPVLFQTEGRKMAFQISRELVTKLRELATANKCTMHVLLFALYNILLSKYTGQEDLLIGVPVAGRTHPDLQHLFGMFVNNLCIRTTVAGDQPFTRLLAAINRNMTDALACQDYPFDELVKTLGRKPDPGRNPLFDSMFIYQNMTFPDGKAAGLTLSRYFIDPGVAKFDLSIEVFEERDVIHYNIEYATKLFRQGKILRLACHFENLVRRVVEEPWSKVLDLALISYAKYDEYIRRFNDTATNYPRQKKIHELFEEQVLKTPGNIAIEYKDKQITYKQLNEDVSNMSALLRQRGVKEGSVAGILLRRSPALITGILAVLKCGGCYLPVDPDLPESRKKFLIGNSRCRIVIDSDGTIVDQEQAFSREEETTAAAGLAYIIYTSGTTGDPKGVMIAHHSLVNYITWAAGCYIGNEKTDFPLYTSVSFDLTVTSIFAPLITGNKIVVYDDSGQDLLIEQIIRENKVDIIKLTPSHLKIIRESKAWPSSGKSRVKKFIVGGESLDTSLAREIHDKWGGDIIIYNEYGPTEATVGCMIYRFDPTQQLQSVPIGIPAANTKIYLLDKHLKPVPAGVDGEIFISGDSVAEGYLFNESLTARKFLPDPFAKGERMYRTGDMARRHSDGTIEFFGRVDRQVKINGHRIELAEIEAAMKTHPDISEALVTLKTDTEHQQILCAYYTVREKQELHMDRSALRYYLSARLPVDMIPVHFTALENIPLTRNGKVDYEALPAVKVNEKVRKRALPENKTEGLCIEVWEKVLNTTGISTTDNFFELGGDSIKAVQITSRLLDKGIALRAKDLLVYQTIGEISRHARATDISSRYEQGMINGQKHLIPVESWFINRGFEHPGYYNQSVLLRFKRKISLILLQVAFETIIKQHDALRMNYDPANQVLFYNENHYGRDFFINEYTLDNSNGLERICTGLKNSFDITSTLLLKAAVIKTDADTDMLFITAHHLVIDVVSWRILLEDLYNIYEALEKEETIPVFQKTASLIDWGTALKQYAAAGTLRQDDPYWSDIDEATFHIPQDFETSRWKVADVHKVSGTLDRDKTAFLLKDAHRIYRTDVPVLLNVALAMALKEWTGQESLLVEQENHGRHLPDPDTSRTIGWFTAMYPVRLTVINSTIGDQIMAIKEQLRMVPEYGMGYGMRNKNGNELTELRFNYLGQFGDELDNDLFTYSDLSTGPDVSPGNAMTAKIELNAMIRDGELSVDVSYNASAHKETTIVQFVETLFYHLNRVLEHLQTAREIHFTPSDFDAVDLNDEELNALFG